ncbi:MAG TPA: pilus assembly protein TadG-related protein [Candidatus Limnocylindrales bacterium]|nr:pilus assembly protein TadG-related protein [Candidatus Limnocylindrales bacterium]
MIYVAVFLLSSLWLTSLAIDMGKLMTTKTELQKAADSAALAGASAINPSTGALTQATARTRAVIAGGANTALQETAEPVVIDPNADVDFPVVAGNTRLVRVTVHREAATGNPMTTIFARSLGISSLNVHANATAEAAALTAVCDGLLPFAPTLLAGGVPFDKTCGSEYTLHADPAMANGGQFQLLSFPPCNEGPCAGMNGTGGATIRCLMENGYGCCINIGDLFVDTKPGNTVGPVRQGLDARWDEDTDLREGICYQQYIGDGHRVMPVPIVETFAGLNGRTNARITGFAGFFMKVRPTGGAKTMQVTGQFIDYVAPGEPGGGPPPPNALYTVRLVE